jgi:hypothetical protein
MTCIVEVIGSSFFLSTANYISWDKRQAEKAIAGMRSVHTVCQQTERQSKPLLCMCIFMIYSMPVLGTRNIELSR